MKLCLIAPIPPFRGGIAKYCYSLAKELEKRHELLLLSYKRQYPAILYGRKNQIDLACDRKFIVGEFKHLSYDIDSANPASWLETAKKISAFGPDAVIFPWWVAYWAPMYFYLLRSLKRKKIKVIFLGINIFEHEDNAFKKFLTKIVLRSADFIIVHSSQEKTMALEINPSAVVKTHLLPVFEYEATPVVRDDLRLNLLFFGFVRPYKGLDYLLKALGSLRDDDIRLTIAGEFWHDKDKYLQLIDALGISANVEIVDRYVTDKEMSLYFSRSDLIVVPYKEAKTSGIIATAYGFGKPVLATDVGGFHEIVRDNLTGRLVPPNDPESLAKGIAWFRENRQIDFAQSIADYTSRNMSWNSLAKTIEECVTLE